MGGGDGKIDYKTKYLLMTEQYARDITESIPISKLEELIQADFIARTVCGQSTKVIGVGKIQDLIDEAKQCTRT